jgi:hypothetical protein
LKNPVEVTVTLPLSEPAQEQKAVRTGIRAREAGKPDPELLQESRTEVENGEMSASE